MAEKETSENKLIPSHHFIYVILSHTEKISRPSHYALLPIRYFVQLLMWVVSGDTPYLSKPEKILWASRNALLPMRYFEKVIMWVISGDTPYLSKSEKILWASHNAFASDRIFCTGYHVGR